MINRLLETLPYKKYQLEAVLKLTEEGYTIPFIARYRKEAIGTLSEIDVQAILKEKERLDKLEDRKNEILEILKDREVLTPALTKNIANCDKLVQLEELYKPFKKKQKTKATIAKEQGLGEVALGMMRFTVKRDSDFSKFLNKGFNSKAEIIEAASHIIIEEISNNFYLRNALKEYFKTRGLLEVVLKDQAKDKDYVYKNYYNYKKPLKYVESFQILAINRGEKLKALKSSIDVELDLTYKMERILRLNEDLAYYPEIIKAVKKAYSAFLKPSICRELWSELLETAEKRATTVFTNNLRAILLKRPVKTNSVIGLDPGFRTGCKVAVIDKNGNYLAHDVIYPTPPYSKIEQAKAIISKLVKKYNVDVISIGDGTASYETSQFVSETIHSNKLDCSFTVISESGASVYSASKKANEEFPELDLTIRSAISIARRVQSFLDEVIKIPPESIGVGMYQHDITPKLLKESLAFEVTSVVHHVGVDINKASNYLLEHISGITPSVAKNIVKYRHENSTFKSRKELMEVKGFGKKAYELASGFCRVNNIKNPLDNTIIHPTDYSKVSAMLKTINKSRTISSYSYSELTDIFGNTEKQNFESSGISNGDIEFIYSAFLERAIDPRDSLPEVKLHTALPSMEDFIPYSVWEGVVKNVTDFGIFVSLGIKVDGLIHVSRFKSKSDMFNNFSPGKNISVMVEDVDLERKRIQLTLNN